MYSINSAFESFQKQIKLVITGIKNAKNVSDDIIISVHTLTSHGIAPDKKKIEAISNIQTPTNTSQVKSFLGIVNYCHQFIANFSTIPEPLQRPPQKKNQKFIRGKQQQEAFQTLKQRLPSVEVMCYYNPIAETNIIVDATPKGLGAFLSQKQKNGQFKPISHSSRALTDVES